MNHITKQTFLPERSIMRNSFQKPDYIDTYFISIPVNQNYTIDYLTGIFFTSISSWIKLLLAFRNSLVKLVGLKKGEIIDLKEPEQLVFYNIGSNAVFFQVINRNEQEIVMGEDDKHLMFNTSLMVEKTSDEKNIQLFSSTLVIYHNAFGRFYFFFVKPFHKLIIKTLLKKTFKKIRSA